MRIRKAIYAAFLLWPTGFGMLLVSLLPFLFKESPAERVFSLILIVGSLIFNALWAFFVDRSGWAQRVHDLLGLTRNPFTGQYGATQREIEEEWHHRMDPKGKG